jgi:hypothetical protein
VNLHVRNFALPRTLVAALASTSNFRDPPLWVRRCARTCAPPWWHPPSPTSERWYSPHMLSTQMHSHKSPLAGTSTQARSARAQHLSVYIHPPIFASLFASRALTQNTHSQPCPVARTGCLAPAPVNPRPTSVSTEQTKQASNQRTASQRALKERNSSVSLVKLWL